MVVLLLTTSAYGGVYLLISRLYTQRSTTKAYRVFRYGFPATAVATLLGLSGVIHTIGRLEPYQWAGTPVDPQLVRMVSSSFVLLGVVGTTALIAIVAIASSGFDVERFTRDDTE